MHAVSAMAATSRNEAGCIDYRHAVDIDDPLVADLFEVWESNEARDAHFGSAHFAAYSEFPINAVDGSAVFTR